MSASLQCAMIEPNERSQLIFSTAHHRSTPLRVLFGTPHQKEFFEDILLNTHYRNIAFSLFQEYQPQGQKEIVLLADVPADFEALSRVVKLAGQAESEVVLILLKTNKKYLNMIEKKLGLHAEPLVFSHNKFVGINDKLRECVQQSYDLNRKGFYAYGSYINYFRSSLLKKIFRTDQINVAQLAKSFGFTTPPRVKEGSFLTEKARKEKKAEKLKLKKEKEAKTETNVEVPVAEEKQEKVAKIGKTNKIKDVQKAEKGEKVVNIEKPKTKKIKKITQ